MAFKRVIIRRVGPLSWLLEPMYKCCNCQKAINWYIGVTSSPGASFRCKACNFEQNEPGESWLVIFGIALVSPVLLFVALFATDAFASSWPLLTFCVAAFATTALLYILRVKRGRLVPTNPTHRTIHRTIIFLLFALMIVYFIWRWL